MNKSTVTLFAITTMTMMLFPSCSKEKEDNDGIEIPEYGQNNGHGENTDSNKGNLEKTYYVKYEVNASFSRNDKAYKLTLKYISESGQITLRKDLTLKKSFSWDGTFGPFKKGQTVTLDCNTDIGQYPSNLYRGVGDYYGRILVKEGDGDYLVKDDKTSGTTSGPGLVYSTGLHLQYTLK